MKTYRVVCSVNNTVTIQPMLPLPAGLLTFWQLGEGLRRQKIAEFNQWLGYIDETPR